MRSVYVHIWTVLSFTQFLFSIFGHGFSFPKFSWTLPTTLPTQIFSLSFFLFRKQTSRAKTQTNQNFEKSNLQKTHTHNTNTHATKHNIWSHIYEQNSKIKGCANKAKWYEMSTKYHWVHFVLAIYCLGWHFLLFLIYPVILHWRQRTFLFQEDVKCREFLG